MWLSRNKLIICLMVTIFLIVTSCVNSVNAESTKSGFSASSTVDPDNISDQLEDDSELETEKLYAKSYIVDPAKFSDTSNLPYDWLKANARQNEGEEDSGGARTGRAIELESEPNNDFNNADALTAGNDMQGNLTYQTDEDDYFYIYLNGGGGITTNKITIKPTFISPPDIANKIAGITLAFYTVYDGELYYLDYRQLASETAGPTIQPYPWPTTTELIAHADSSHIYYLRIHRQVFTSGGTVVDPDVIVGYNLKITVEQSTNTDNNNDMLNGTLIDGPISDERVTHSIDHWDWFIIETLTTEKPTDTYVSLKITDSERTETDATTLFVFYVKAYIELIYYDSSSGQYIAAKGTGDHHEQYGPNPIIVEINATYEKAYLGIHLQQFYRYGGSDYFVAESGENSFIEYKIEKLYVDLYNKPPYLQELKESPVEGNMLDDYTFSVVYRDVENDPPLFVNVTVDGENYKMELDTSAKPSYQDGEYDNGEQYIKVVPGSELSSPIHATYVDVEYYFSTRDYLESLDLPMSSRKTGKHYFSVIDNTPPKLSSNPPEEWIIYEDTNASYFDISTIFDDIDETKYPGELIYQIYTPFYDMWDKNKVVTDNVTITLLEDNWTLRCEVTQDKFGIDYIKIRATDTAGELKDEYVEYLLKVNLKPVNDAPVLDNIIDYIDDYAMNEDWWVILNFSASDDVDGNVDTLIFSTNIDKIIPFLDPDDPDYNEDYQYSFDENTGQLSFIPANEQVGKYKITVWVTDDGEIEEIGLSDTKTFWLEIENTNDPPLAVISSPSDEDTFNTSVKIFFDGMNSTDPDLLNNDDKLRYIWKSNISGDLKGGETFGQFSMTIDKAGLHEIKLTVKDNARKISSTTIEIKIIGIIEGIGEDTDGDGMPDSWETQFGFNPAKRDADQDKDNDNYTNLQEFLGEDGLPSGGDSSDPTDAYSIPGDRDGDLLPDGWEFTHFGHLNLDGTGDPDGDGYNNLAEYYGPDGKPGGSDSSDPLAPEDVPVDKEVIGDKKTEDDELDLTWILLILIVIIIIVLLLAFMFIKKRREEEREAEEELAAMYSREQPPQMIMAPPPMMPMTATQPYPQPQPPQPMPLQMMPPAVSMAPPPSPPTPTISAPAPEPMLPPPTHEETVEPEPDEEPRQPKRKPKKPKVEPSELKGEVAKGPKPKLKAPKLKPQQSKCPSCGIPVQPSWFLCPSCKIPLS